MKVSLIMPTINVTTELDLFLKSLKAQTYKDFELIVVDQNEGNEVFEIVKDYEEDFKIKYVKSDEKGLSLNRNRGLILMKGEIVGFPDDDCEYSSDTLEKVVEFLIKGAVVGIFEGGSEFGPRALCHRSLIARADDIKLKIILNEKVKQREIFRPFGGIILRKNLSCVTRDILPSDYMLSAVRMNDESSKQYPANTQRQYR